MARLVVMEGPETGRIFKLSRNNTVGRNPGCAVVLSDPEVFDRHVRINERKTGFVYKDLCPLPRLSLNGKAARQGRLRHGDLLRLGQTHLLFHDEEEEDLPGPADMADVNPLSPEIRMPGGSEPSVPAILDLADHGEDVTLRLAALLKIGETISSVDSLPKALQRILDVIFETFPADRATVVLFDEDRNRFQKGASRVRKGGPLSAGGRVSRAVLHHVFKSGDSLLLKDVRADDRFEKRDSVTGQNLLSILAVPLCVGDRFLGMIVLESMTKTDAFEEDDLGLLTAMGHQAAMAVENARLLTEVREKTIIESELELAEDIQRRLIPESLPHRSDCEIFGALRPAQGVVGSFYDLVEKDENLFIMMGDVSGRSLNAGLVMMMVRSSLLPLIEGLEEPGEMLEELNRLLLADTLPEVFVRFLLLQWRPAAETLICASAGFENLLLLRKDETEAEGLPKGSIPLGLEDRENAFHHALLPFREGDTVLLFSEGLVNLEDPEGRRLGLGRLHDEVRALGNRSPQDLVQALLARVQEFRSSAEQRHDIVLMALRASLSPS